MIKFGNWKNLVMQMEVEWSLAKKVSLLLPRLENSEGSSIYFEIGLGDWSLVAARRNWTLETRSENQYDQLRMNGRFKAVCHDL